MKWREQLALLLGAASPFAVSHADAASISEEPHAGPRLAPAVDHDSWVYADPADRQRLIWLAGHSSHSSHASHSSHYSGSGGYGHASHTSHASHYSGSGSYAAPDYTPTVITRPAPAPRAPVHSPPAAARLHTAPSSIADRAAQPYAAGTAARPTKTDTRDFVQRVQIALIVQGYDPGPANGVLSAATKAALKKYQEAHSLSATGFMDLPTLRLLGVLN